MPENWNKRMEDDEFVLTAKLADISTASSAYVISPFRGKIKKIYSVISGTIATANAVLTASIGGVNITGGAITIAYSGSAAGDIDSCAPTAKNEVAEGQAIKITTNGASTNTVYSQLTIILKRNI